VAVLSAVSGMAIAFGMPVVPRLVAAVVPSPDRLRVNARIGVATSLSSVIAPSAAGTITIGAGPGWAALATAIVFAGSAMTLGGVRTSARPHIPDGRAGAPARPRPSGGRTGMRTAGSRGAGGQGGPFHEDLAEGWREVKARPWFLASVLGHGVWHFMAGLFLTLGPITAVEKLGGEASWVMIVQVGTVGMVAGVFAAPRLPIRRPLVGVQVGAACYLAPMGALAVPLPAAGIAAAYFVAMFGLGVLSPLWETVVADEIPERALGRVRSFDQLISFASRPFGLAVAAPLAGVVGMTALMAAGGLLVAAANLASIPGPRRLRMPRFRMPRSAKALAVPGATAVTGSAPAPGQGRSGEQNGGELPGSSELPGSTIT